jgi:hypothetical protein
MTRDAGTELRKALGFPEPNYSEGYKNPHYHGGYRKEDQEEAEAQDVRFEAYERASRGLADDLCGDAQERAASKRAA